MRRIFADDFINLQGMPVSLKILTIVGYMAVLGQLVFILLVELAGDRLPTVEYTLAGQTNMVPMVVMTIAALAFILGWAYLLTGTATAGVRIFLPVLALFGLQLFLATGGNLPLIFLETLFLLITLALFWDTHSGCSQHAFPVQLVGCHHQPATGNPGIDQQPVCLERSRARYSLFDLDSVETA